MGRGKTALALLLAAALVLAAGGAWALAEEEQTVLADTEQIYAAVTGYDPAGEWGPVFTLAVENRTGRTLRFDMTMVSAGGRMCDVPWSASVLPGERIESGMIWDEAALAAAGIRYIDTVQADLRAYDGESHQDVFSQRVSWSAPTDGAEGPAVEERSFDDAFQPVQLLSGELSAAVVACDTSAGAPALTLYLENGTDEDAYFTARDVTVNGAFCDPWWGQPVAAGKTAYSVMAWTPALLDRSGVSRAETVELRLEVEDAAGQSLAAGEEPARLTLAEGVPEPTPAPTPEPETAGELDPAVRGAVEGSVYTNEFFGLTCTLPSDWMFYTDEQMQLLRGVAMQALGDAAYADGIEQAVNDSYLAAGASLDGRRNINLGVGQLTDGAVTAGQLLDEIQQELEQAADTGAAVERTERLLAGEERPALRMTYNDTSLGLAIPVYIRLVYVVRDGYAMQITMSSLAREDGVDDIAGFFSGIPAA